MTIRQQGGVFGRNPKFNDVEAENLTVTDATMGQAQVDNININGNTISSTDANGNITFDPNGTGRVVAASQFQALGGAYIETPNTGVSQFLQFDRNQATIGDIGQIQFYTNDGAGNPTEYGRITGAATRINNGIELGEVYISTTLNGVLREAGRFTSAGNLAFPSGQGIDFSATAGTGTSELLDDYEEGTWTPVIDPGVSYTGTLTLSGNYTKIGRLVWVNFRVVVAGGSLSSSAGALLVTGIPFSGAADSVGGYGSGQTLTGGATITPYVYTTGVALAGAVISVTSIYGTAAYSAA